MRQDNITENFTDRREGPLQITGELADVIMGEPSIGQQAWPYSAFSLVILHFAELFRAEFTLAVQEVNTAANKWRDHALFANTFIGPVVSSHSSASAV
jgi:hypothetical protein